MNFLSWLSGSTPGGAVGEAGAKVIEGFGNTVQGLIEEFHLPPEAAQKFEMAFAQLKFDTMKAYFMTVADARQMLMNTRSRMPAVLTLFYTLAFISMSTGLLWFSFYMPTVTLSSFQAGLIGAVYGAVSKEAMLAASFWLGSSNDQTPILPPLNGGTNGSQSK